MTIEETRFRPAGRDLLAVAIDAYITSILPTVPSDQRHIALMVAKAMSIAALEWTSSPFGPGSVSDSDRIRAADIRNGRYDEDDDDRQALWKSLDADVQARLAIDQGSLPSRS